MAEPSITGPWSIFGEIEIVSAPEGPAPIEIRRCWIGVQMPCMWREDRQEADEESGGPGWIVSQPEAIEALRLHSPEAYVWWREQGFPEPGEGMIFHFDIGCAREIKRVLPRAQVLAAVLREN